MSDFVEITPSFETPEQLAGKVIDAVNNYNKSGDYEPLAELTLEILAKLNSFDSHAENSKGREQIANFIKEYAEILGKNVELITANDTFHLVIVNKNSWFNFEDFYSEEKNPVPIPFIHVHSDVFEAESLGISIKDGIVSGRGSNDMLSQLAIAMINMVLNHDEDIGYFISGDEESKLQEGVAVLGRLNPLIMLDLEPTSDVQGEIITRTAETKFFVVEDDQIDESLFKYLEEHPQVIYFEEYRAFRVPTSAIDKATYKMLRARFDLYREPERNIRLHEDARKTLEEIARDIYGPTYFVEGARPASEIVEVIRLNGFNSTAFFQKINAAVIGVVEFGARHKPYEATTFESILNLLKYIDLFSKRSNEIKSRIRPKAN